MLSCQKDKFNIPVDICYLNGAYMSPNLKAVETAGIAGLKAKSQPWNIPSRDFFQPVENLKKTFATLINSSEPHRIALIPSVSYGIATVVKNIALSSKNNIVLTDEGFPSNYYAWKRKADAVGAEIKIISAPREHFPKGELWNKAILHAINENTTAVSLGNIHWANGVLFDLKKIREKTRAVGAYLIIDGTQSVGAYPFDIKTIQADALICAGYKWLLGGYTFGLGYFGPSFDDGIPIEENWINRLDSHQFQNLVNYQNQYKPLANRYMMGEQSNFISIPMLQAALDQLLTWGVDNIQRYCESISEVAIQKLIDIGCKVEQKEYRCHHLFGVQIAEHMNMQKLKANFEKNKVYVSQRGNTIRIAPNVYNTAEDFETLVDCFVDGSG